MGTVLYFLLGPEGLPKLCPLMVSGKGSGTRVMGSGSLSPAPSTPLYTGQPQVVPQDSDCFIPSPSGPASPLLSTDFERKILHV